MWQQMHWLLLSLALLLTGSSCNALRLCMHPGCGISAADAMGTPQHHPEEGVRLAAVSRKEFACGIGVIAGLTLGTGAEVQAVVADETMAVAQTTDEWLKTVTSHRRNAAQETAALYAKDAVLWGTVSEEIRKAPDEILDYFKFFANLPNLQVSYYKPYIRVYDDFAINSGVYTFLWNDPAEPGGKKVKKARYSFTYKKDASSRNGWSIVDHHSSAIPNAPAQLKHAEG
ncbi:unnamed protein product [Chrysoparadoxa australica]